MGGFATALDRSEATVDFYKVDCDRAIKSILIYKI